jgi:hypothetical protein
LPSLPAYRSGATDFGHDSSLQLSPESLGVLNAHGFYDEPWGTTLGILLNRYFDGLITAVNSFTAPLFEAIQKFDGLVVARVFGREAPRSYTEFFVGTEEANLLEQVETMRERFVFGQGYDALSEIEDRRLARRAHTISVPATSLVWGREREWRGDRQCVLLLCPQAHDGGYYEELYHRLKAIFGTVPHLIFGRQNRPISDDCVLPWLTDGELLELYARVAVFAYPSHEPRHVHYSPIEAMIIGCPVLYMRNALIDRLAGTVLPGRCENHDDMLAKTKRLISGDTLLSQKIRCSQRSVAAQFRLELARQQWAEVLASIPGGPA